MAFTLKRRSVAIKVASFYGLAEFAGRSFAFSATVVRR
jgi:hypothetical protein